MIFIFSMVQCDFIKTQEHRLCPRILFEIPKSIDFSNLDLMDYTLIQPQAMFDT